MSHQTGIKANAELLKFFGKCKDGKTRVIKISIKNEELTLIDHKKVDKDWEKDYDKCVKSLIEDDVPCYVLYRLDPKTPIGHAWLLISWTPDSATVREKMLYASTKATLKLEFGSANIKEELHATSKDETTLDGYFKHKKAFSAPNPLTTREEELEELKRNEVKTDYSVDSRQQTLGGINCPMSEAAQNAIADTVRGSFNYLQFRIDLQEEKIHLVKADNIVLEKLSKEIPADHARYHIYLFKHTHEGDYQESFIFIYSMPGYACTVKERMMYSSCKGPFLDAIQGLGLEIVKKLEIDSGDELTEDYFQDELHPKKILHRPQFSKPKGPPNRGAKRLTKPQAVE
uniref:Twinfilin n=1 Tax=Corethrella appendiculata TaxID=1370023 RepID=U5EWR4_9DIPT